MTVDVVSGGGGVGEQLQETGDKIGSNQNKLWLTFSSYPLFVSLIV